MDGALPGLPSQTRAAAVAHLDLPGLWEGSCISTNSRSRIRQRSFVGMGTESRVGTGSALPAAAKIGRDVLGRGASRAAVAAVGPWDRW